MDEIVRPHLGKTYNSISSLDEEVPHVSASIVHAASSIIPTRKPKKGKKRFSTDPELRDLSTRCKSAWKKWKEAGRPSQGPEHEEKKRLSRLTKQCANKCRANLDRKSGKKCSGQRIPGVSRHHPINPLLETGCYMKGRLRQIQPQYSLVGQTTSRHSSKPKLGPARA